MAERPEGERRTAADEADSFAGGPGLVATKSQARGALAGSIIGLIVGGLLGLLLGVLFDAVVVGVPIGLVAGATVGGVAAGAQNPKQKLGEGSEADR